ncbi:hypothetical protein RJ528_000652 [Klebsiella oxytoca]|nr:hypothetical protein [Klebsiella oxytoca]
MTDITELAQREKFEAWVEEADALPWGILKKHRNQDGSYPGPHYTYMWKAWQAASAELVEALEKALKSNEFLKGQLSELANFNPDWDKLEASYDSWREIAAELLVAKERIAELETNVSIYESAAAKHLERVEVAERRNAELESRTVKLPQPLGFKPPSGRDVILLSELTEALTATDIKWEAE